MPLTDANRDSHPAGRTGEVFGAFLKLGLTAFGGPVAHLGYMRDEFVQRRGWLDDARFAQLLAICQFLPGPASSQLGFAIGLLRGGWRGALCAFVGFTLPSALLMFGFASLAPLLGLGLGPALLHGLKLVAVAVVAHALVGMARQLAPDLPRALIALGAAALLLAVGSVWMQLAAIALGAALGGWCCRRVRVPAGAPLSLPGGGRLGALCLALFLAGLLATLLVPASGTPGVAAVAGAFYRAGALVFGGGHVVLPLLEAETVARGWVSADGFLAGYGAAQAVPGPLFTFAAYLGAVSGPEPNGPMGAAIALVAVFLPGLQWPVRMRQSWACSARRSTTRSGQAR
jgi:chromate transporter